MDSSQNDNQINANDKKWTDDLFNIYTIDECRKYFEEVLEPGTDENLEMKDKLSMLKSCISLLSRLENTIHQSFAGRVLTFLARNLPLLDQSGVNLRSEASNRELPMIVIENLKVKKAEKDKQTSRLLEQDIEEGETLSDDESNGITLEDDLDKIYKRFWDTQRFLIQPNSLFDKDNWAHFRSNVETLVRKIESKSADLNIWNASRSFMTEPKPLSLQLNDINMRRCILVQILIVLQYLELPVEMRPESRLVLDKLQRTWSSNMTKQIYVLLDSMPNSDQGRQFFEFIRHVLKREELWIKWKNEKCYNPKRPAEDEEPVNMRGTYHKRRKLSDELRSAKSYNLQVIGSQEMTRLWNAKPSQKYNTPDLARYFDVPKEKQTEIFKDPNYNFKVLRLLRKSPHFFIPAASSIQGLDGYLKALAEKNFNNVSNHQTNENQTNKTT